MGTIVSSSPGSDDQNIGLICLPAGELSDPGQ